MKIYFVTSSDNKVNEIAKTLHGTCKVQQLKADLSEIQSLDLHDIIRAKLENAKDSHPEKTLMVEDTSFEIDVLGGLPGTFIKFFEQQVDDQGIYEMARGRQPYGNLSARAKVCIGLLHNNSVNFFDGTLEGKVVEQEGDGWGFDRIFIPHGYNERLGTLGMEVKSAISHRARAVESLNNFLDSIKH
ncbi:hypothetical protein DYH10_01540 [Candidatus Saccharibacteria bacterium CPR2]|nr:hypothetical protein [Candidatus Saccharibacteria bacterium CPR2]